MNNILEEITYSDGRMDDVVKSLYTPAKLKLRARTYEGINRNLSKRRGTTTSNTFSIPNAFMAVEVPSGNEGGSGYTVIASNNLEEIKASEIQSKKLKINAGQASGITSKAISVPIEEKEQPQVEETPVTEVSVEEVETPVIPESETHEVPNVVVTNEVEPQETVQVSEPEVAVTQTPTVDPLDVAREKVLNTQNIAPEEDVIDRAEKTDMFKELEAAKNEYIKANEENKHADEVLESTLKELETAKNNLEKIIGDNDRLEAEIQERDEITNSIIKDTEEWKKKNEELKEETRKKIQIYRNSKAKELKDKKVKEKKSSEAQDKINQCQENHEKESIRRETVLEKRNEESKQNNNRAQDENRKIQDEYQRNLNVFNAITLPEGINLENEMEEVASISKFPTFINSENDYYNDVEEEYTYKKVA